VTVWVTGASGMLGRCVARRLTAMQIPWVGTDLDVDVADHAAVAAYAFEHHPRAIINCAAHTAVDAAEAEEDAALRVNGAGPAVLAGLSVAVGAAFVHFSTDYVFDGERAGEHDEGSPVGPCNAYGRTKLEGERGVLRAYGEFEVEGVARSWYVIRTSWLFGAGHSSFVDTMWKLMLEKAELRVVADQVGRPTYAQDLADFAIRLMESDASTRLASGIWHFANTGQTSWHGFAGEIRACMLRHGLDVTVGNIHAVSTEEFPRPARRPRNSVLSTNGIEAKGIVPRKWQDALAEYIEQRAAQRGMP
jgi:dTDP-4-dehydrorhamnose reductase